MRRLLTLWSSLLENSTCLSIIGEIFSAALEQLWLDTIITPSMTHVRLSGNKTLFNWVRVDWCSHWFIAVTRFSYHQDTFLAAIKYLCTAEGWHLGSNISRSLKNQPTYLIIPADNIQTCRAEIANHLELNRAKSAKIVFVPPRSKRVASI